MSSARRIAKPNHYDGLSLQDKVLLANAETFMKQDSTRSTKIYPFDVTSIKLSLNSISFIGLHMPWSQNMPAPDSLRNLIKRDLLKEIKTGHFYPTKSGFDIGRYHLYLNDLKSNPYKYELIPDGHLTIRYFGEPINSGFVVFTLDNSNINISNDSYEIIGNSKYYGSYIPFAVEYGDEFRSLQSIRIAEQEPVKGSYIIIRGGIDSVEEIIRVQDPFIYSLNNFTLIIRSSPIRPLTESEAGKIRI